MAKVRLFLDKRRLDKEGRGQVRVVVTKSGTSAMLTLGVSIRPDQWQDDMVVRHNDEILLNRLISIKKGIIERTILEQTTLGAYVGKTAKDVVESLREALDPDYAAQKKEKEMKKELERNSFTLYFQKFVQTKDNEGTRNLYQDTLRKIRLYCESEGQDYCMLSFNQITKSWLESFESFCMRTESQNTASRHLRDIRAVFNGAIDEKLTVEYPFRKLKIKHEETHDKSYTSEELRTLFMAKCYPGGEQEAVDMFKLMFCLIGINCVDLAYACPAIRGRIEYVRRKTHKFYSVKLEPEAHQIIQRYAGEVHLVDILEHCRNYKTYFNRSGKTLKKVGKTRVAGKKSKGEAILPDVCWGAARTSWATIAQSELDIPRDVIAAALGHHTIDVTTTYLRTDWRKKVDRANRMVLDWVFYSEKTTY